MKKILTIIMFTLSIGTSLAFFWSKSCEDGNTDKCFKEINQLKKDYSKEEQKVFKEQNSWDKLQEKIVELQSIQSGHEEKMKLSLGIMDEIKNDANNKRSILQSLGF